MGKIISLSNFVHDEDDEEIKFELEEDIEEEEVEIAQKGVDEYVSNVQKQEMDLDEINNGLEKFADVTRNELGKEQFEKASNPFYIFSKLAKNFKENIKELISTQEYKSVPPRTKKKTETMVKSLEDLEDNIEESKPKIKSEPKKPKEKPEKLKSNHKKGFIQRLKESLDAKKFRKTRKAIESAKEYTGLLVNKYQEKCENKKVSLESINDKSLKYILESIRDSETTNLEDVRKLREIIKQKQKEQVESLRETLDTIQNRKISMELSKQTDLTDEQIDELIHGGYIGLDTDGTLQIDNKKFPYLKVEDIKGTPLEEKLRKLASMPKVSDLTDIEVLQLAKSIKVQDGKIRVNFSYLFDGKTPGDLSWVAKNYKTALPNGVQNEEETKEVKEAWNIYQSVKRQSGKRLQLFKNMYGEDFYIDGMESILPQALEGFEEIGTYEEVLEELDNTQQLTKLQILDKQISRIDDKATDLEEKRTLTRREKKTRKTLKSIAVRKVLELENQGVSISDVINEDGLAEGRTVNEAEKTLDLDRAIKADSSKLKKIQRNKEEK